MIQFDYEGYIFDFLDKQPEKLSSLQSLSVRKLTPPTNSSSDDEHDRCELTGIAPWRLVTYVHMCKSSPFNSFHFPLLYIDTRFCYGLTQISTLTELDLSGNSIPPEMQVNLQVSNTMLEGSLILKLNNLKFIHFTSSTC